MSMGSKVIEKAAYNPYFTVIASLSSIFGLVWIVYEKLNKSDDLLVPIAVFVISVVFLLIISVYSIKVRAENQSIRDIGKTYYDVNKMYRNELKKVFSGEAIVTNPDDLIKIEEEVLRAVCQRIRNTFNGLIGKNCMVTIKLITMEEEHKYAQTYVRSLEKCKRDGDEIVEYDIGTGENTSFDQALEIRKDKPSHFFSPNLTKEKNKYYNQRQHYERHYRSTIVVPIRCKDSENSVITDDIGFLCIDTKSTNRLNGGYHVYLLSSFAAQMYNFMSLMRGNYLVLVDKKNDK